MRHEARLVSVCGHCRFASRDTQSRAHRRRRYWLPSPWQSIRCRSRDSSSDSRVANLRLVMAQRSFGTTRSLEWASPALAAMGVGLFAVISPSCPHPASVIEALRARYLDLKPNQIQSPYL